MQHTRHPPNYAITRLEKTTRAHMIGGVLQYTTRINRAQSSITRARCGGAKSGPGWIGKDTSGAIKSTTGTADHRTIASTGMHQTRDIRGAHVAGIDDSDHVTRGCGGG